MGGMGMQGNMGNMGNMGMANLGSHQHHHVGPAQKQAVRLCYLVLSSGAMHGFSIVMHT